MRFGSLARQLVNNKDSIAIGTNEIHTRKRALFYSMQRKLSTDTHMHDCVRSPMMPANDDGDDQKHEEQE
ncbi:unnamed protein product [Soboliphyme baturini]|uniref:Uncharacterized protein n=1 Tax=Soboliphyme baturini TaxID=241478 RepID=A0A183IC68_9BILA|nr:unnamed protein product [Soboliphyme baturini]